MAKSALFEHKTKEHCPECGGELIIRSKSGAPFQGCSNYPKCQFIRPLGNQNDGHIIKTLDGQLCPQCGATLVVRQGKFGMFIGCSAYPECDYIAQQNSTNLSVSCPQCHTGHLVERTSRYGKVFYACDNYPQCQFLINHRPLAGECAYCHYPLLIEKKVSKGLKVICANKQCNKEVKNDE